MGRGSGQQYSVEVDTAARSTVKRIKDDAIQQSQPTWTDESIAKALKVVADKLGRFPTDWELHQYGLAGMRTPMRAKGLQYWGQRIGYPARAQGQQIPERLIALRQQREDYIESSLKRLHKNRTRMMTPEELDKHIPRLSYAINAHGGRRDWAQKLGLSTSTAAWNEETIAVELGQFLQGRDYFPSQREFKEANKESLLMAMRRHKGLEYWVERSGLPRAKSGKAGKRKPLRHRRWTHDLLAEELDKFLQNRDYFPSQREFKEANKGYLLNALNISAEGMAYWVEHSGLPRASTNSKRS